MPIHVTFNSIVCYGIPVLPPTPKVGDTGNERDLCYSELQPTEGPTLFVAHQNIHSLSVIMNVDKG